MGKDGSVPYRKKIGPYAYDYNSAFHPRGAGKLSTGLSGWG